MFADRRPTGLKIVVTLAFLNVLATLVYFVLGEWGLLGTAGLVENLWIYGVAVTVTAVLPLALGAYGLFRRKLWGLSFFTVGSGAYLCSSLLIILAAVSTRNFQAIIFYVSLYLFFFNLLADFYVWNFRHHFRDF